MSKRDVLLAWLVDHNYSKETVLTCDDCGCKDRCRYVYDPYNLDGDCLGDK